MVPAPPVLMPFKRLAAWRLGAHVPRDPAQVVGLERRSEDVSPLASREHPLDQRIAPRKRGQRVVRPLAPGRERPGEYTLDLRADSGQLVRLEQSLDHREAVTSQ